MAASKLVLTFKCASGDSKSFSYAHAKNNITTSQVKTVVNALITNGSIFADAPLSAISAKIVTTTEEPFDLSE